MKLYTFTLVGAAPYSQSKPIFEPKLDKEGPDDYERRTWRHRIHRTDDGQVFIPPMALKNCLAEAAKFLSVQIPGKGKATYTKHFEAGVMIKDPIPLHQSNNPERPITVDDIEGEWLFLNADGKRGSGRRVMRCMPRIDDWTGLAHVYVLDETITKNVFEHHLRQAGQFIGIGRFRPRNNGYYGRFGFEDLAVSDLDLEAA